VNFAPSDFFQLTVTSAAGRLEYFLKRKELEKHGSETLTAFLKCTLAKYIPSEYEIDLFVMRFALLWRGVACFDYFSWAAR
jgi:hypothetical protein